MHPEILKQTPPFYLIVPISAAFWLSGDFFADLRSIMHVRMSVRGPNRKCEEGLES